MISLEKAVTKLGNHIELLSQNNSLKNNILIIGVFHGDEPQGKFLIDNYIKSSETEVKIKSPLNNLLFIPCLNPDGMGKNTRVNANGVDINRNFPTENFGQDGSSAGKNHSNYYGGISPASEAETKFLIKIIKQYSPKVILSLHAPYKIVNYDGPAQSLAKEISQIIGYPVQDSIGYPTPGSFGTYCGVERNLPIITLELDEEIPTEKLIEPIFKIFDYLKYDLLI